jgi:hypothetical protein
MTQQFIERYPTSTIVIEVGFDMLLLPPDGLQGSLSRTRMDTLDLHTD